MTPTDGFLPPASSERKSADRRERLRVLLHTLGERRWLILATAAVIVAVATLNSAAQDDKYEAVSKVLVGQTDPVNGLFPGAGADSDPDRVARTNLELIENATVAERVERALAAEVELDSEELLDRVDADIENDSDVVAIKVRDEDPEQAADDRQRLRDPVRALPRARRRAGTSRRRSSARRSSSTPCEADELTSPRGRTIERRLSDLEIAAALQGSSVEVVKRAEVPDDPVEPRPFVTFLVSIPIGLLAGLLLALLVSYLDRRLKREEQVEAITQMPVVASIPRRSERLVRRRAGGGVWADPVEAESYGRLATNLRFFNFDRQVKTVLVTSADPGGGQDHRDAAAGGRPRRARARAFSPSRPTCAGRRSPTTSASSSRTGSAAC